MTTTTPDWQTQLAEISDLMREISRETDPQAMVARYGSGMQRIARRDRLVALSRRGLEPPRYRITRSDLWSTAVDPWKEPDRLPEFDRGVLGELLHAGEARVIEHLSVPEDDPGAEYFRGMGSAITVPTWDDGEVLNMVVMMRREPGGYRPEDLPQAVWMANLFGRATRNLVLRNQLDDAYARLEEELQVVARIQRSLLPRELPRIPGLELAAHYEPSRHAGGDYYDMLPLSDGRWGILIADVCGHGTPAAVLMAVTHTLVHAWPDSEPCPGCLLGYLNRHLTARSPDRGAFVTAFLGVYDPAARTLTYASAGHNPPRLKRCGEHELIELDEARQLPLGIMPGITWEPAVIDLSPGDQVIFFTDGITEARGGADGHELFGTDRLDAVMRSCSRGPRELMDAVLQAIADFGGGQPADDDRTMVIARVDGGDGGDGTVGGD